MMLGCEFTEFSHIFQCSTPSLIQHGPMVNLTPPGDAGTARKREACERHQICGCAQWPRSLGEGGALIFFRWG